MLTALAIAWRFASGGIATAFRWIIANPVAALAIVLCLAALYEHRRAGELEHDVATITATRDAAIARANKADADARTAVAANATLQAAVVKLQAANAEAGKITEQAKADGARALARLKTTTAALRAAESRERAAREAIYANDPQCDAWGSLPVCPAIAERLRSAGPS